jgi:cytochrome c-type biogenesis protein
LPFLLANGEKENANEILTWSPFLVTAAGINRFLHFYQRFRRHLHAVEVFSGLLLLFVGGLIFMNRLTWLSGKLGFLNRFAL